VRVMERVLMSMRQVHAGVEEDTESSCGTCMRMMKRVLKRHAGACGCHPTVVNSRESHPTVANSRSRPNCSEQSG
jgi:hypothetical protein